MTLRKGIIYQKGPFVDDMQNLFVDLSFRLVLCNLIKLETLLIDILLLLFYYVFNFFLRVRGMA